MLQLRRVGQIPISVRLIASNIAPRPVKDQPNFWIPPPHRTSPDSKNLSYLRKVRSGEFWRPSGRLSLDKRKHRSSRGEYTFQSQAYGPVHRHRFCRRIYVVAYYHCLLNCLRTRTIDPSAVLREPINTGEVE